MREGFLEEGPAAGPQGSGEGRVTQVCPCERRALPPAYPQHASESSPVLLPRLPETGALCPQALKSCSCSCKEICSKFLIDLMRERGIGFVLPLIGASIGCFPHVP